MRQILDSCTFVTSEFTSPFIFYFLTIQKSRKTDFQGNEQKDPTENRRLFLETDFIIPRLKNNLI